MFTWRKDCTWSAQLLSTICAITFVTGVCSDLQAVPIAVANHNFELPPLVDTAINVGLVPDWTKAGNGNNGTFNPSGNQRYMTTDDEDSALSGGVFGTMDGPRVGFFFQSSTGTMTQTLPDLLTVNTQYTLTLAIGERDGGPINGPFAGYVVELLSGSNVLSSISSDSSPGVAGTFADVSLLYTATGGDPIGQLGIRIGVKNSGYLDFDNVRLTSTSAAVAHGAVPEPLTATLGLMGLGVLGMATRRRAA